jgi:NADPH:quinone reductase-like Zn-dependent oxidoreductase
MAAVLLTGHGGLAKFQYRTDVPVPRPREADVLIQVAAAAIDNTDVNTRIGWYPKAITAGTGAGGAAGSGAVEDVDATWSGTVLEFPRIQGADDTGGHTAEVATGPAGDRIDLRQIARDARSVPRCGVDVATAR